MSSIFHIMAKEDFIDQRRRVKLIQGKSYELLGENEDCFEVIDELKRSALYSKRCFYV